MIVAINDEPEVEVALQREALAEIIDLHDRDHLMDYVTCGSGSYFDFYKIMPTFIYPEKLGAGRNERAERRVDEGDLGSESELAVGRVVREALVRRRGRAAASCQNRGSGRDPRQSREAGCGEAGCARWPSSWLPLPCWP